MKKNLRRISITVTAQTAHHLKNMADACGHRDMGRVVDKLVREHQMATKAHALQAWAEIVEKERGKHGII